MNIAIIFAGGTGQRMNSRTLPKQFLELHGKPILIYTLEHFQKHPQIDGIVLVCVKDWIEYCQDLLDKYAMTKVKSIVPGGKTGQESIRNGLQRAAILFPDDSIVLIHDGVRPLIDEEIISRNIACVQKNGSSVTVSPAVETIALQQEDGKIGEIFERSRCHLAKAPQSFYLYELLDAHKKAQREGRNDFIDSASLMRHYGHTLYTVEGLSENIKITTPSDFYLFRALLDARENSQIFG